MPPCPQCHKEQGYFEFLLYGMHRACYLSTLEAELTAKNKAAISPITVQDVLDAHDFLKQHDVFLVMLNGQSAWAYRKAT